MPLVMMEVIIILLAVVIWILFASKFKAVGNFATNKILKPFEEEEETVEKEVKEAKDIDEKVQK